MTTASTVADYPQTIQKLLDSTECTRDGAMLRLLSRFGIRISEIVRLRVADVDSTRGTVAVHSKGGRWRAIYVDSETMSIIGELTNGRKGGEPLFTDRKGGPISTDSVARILRRYAVRAGVTDGSVRVLRHSLTANLLAAGANVSAIAALLGYRPSAVVRNVTAEEIMAAINI